MSFFNLFRCITNKKELHSAFKVVATIPRLYVNSDILSNEGISPGHTNFVATCVLGTFRVVFGSHDAFYDDKKSIR